MLEEKGNVPVIGVTPYLHVEIEDEDSLTERFTSKKSGGLLDIAVIRTQEFLILRILWHWKIFRKYPFAM